MTLGPDAQTGTEAAEEARRLLGLSLDRPLDDILATLERDAKLRIFVLNLDENGIAGAYQIWRGRPWVLVNGAQPVQRQRFTLAHEFGHHYLGHGETYDKLDYLHDHRPREVQANYFAGAFLAPEAAINRALEGFGRPAVDFDVLVALAAYFGVSAKSMRIRLETLDRLRPEQIAEFDRRIADREHYGPPPLGVTPITDSLTVAKGEGARVPAEMLSRALTASASGLVERDQLPEVLGISEAAIVAQQARELISSE